MQSTPSEFAQHAARAFFPKYDHVSAMTFCDHDGSNPSATSDISSPSTMAELTAAIETSGDALPIGCFGLFAPAWGEVAIWKAA